MDAMSDTKLPRPRVTVATIVACDDAFLLVEEDTAQGRRLNQPAGHVESGETLVAAAVRETLEETAWRVTPTAFVGVYKWRAPWSGETFIRFAFAADPIERDEMRPLDEGIVGALWMPYPELAASQARHRSPLVLRCVDDFRAGLRRPLDLVTEL
jgi:8-oxo-dGTP pyrophosphatase MutT (NUDIX family)